MTLGYILFIFLPSYPVASCAINLSQCFTEIINCANNSSHCTLNISSATAFSFLRTSQGHNVTITNAATALSYTGCATYCGEGHEQFSWVSFSQQYAAWLQPYLALVSQLPFGAQRKADNFMSAILTLGSPALAGYSLFMTLLNVRWVNDKLFAGMDYPSAPVRRSVAQVLGSLQQVPLRIHPGESAEFESLIVHPDNDNWWHTLAEELDYSQRWTALSAISIAWVVIAYLLTAVDSIYTAPNNIESNGQGTGSGWVWLLPIVVGWMILSPKCDYKRVHDAYQEANKQAVVADSDDPTAAPAQVTSNFGLVISPDGSRSRGITSPDELRVPPVFNYARIFSWYRNVYLTSLFYRAAWEKSRNRVGVDGNRIPESVYDDPRESRLGTREQIIHYCRPDDHVSVPLWPRGLFSNMIVASLISLQLQWGTTGAAFLAVWFTPTTGLGCRSLAYLIYGVLSTAVWILLVLSSALGYYAHHLLDDLPALDLERTGQRTPFMTRTANTHSYSYRKWSAIRCHPHARQVYGKILLRVADWLRWIGKSLAIVNAVGIIANSLFQYAGVYTNCYCDSSVFSRGNSAFNVIFPNPNDIDWARRGWIAALALALSSCSLFLGSIYLIRDASPL